MLSYTIAFIRCGNRFLMQERKKPPNANMRNGIGGKIEPGETPLQCVLREVAEETGIVCEHADFAGVVTFQWAPEAGDDGMYVYLIDLPDTFDVRPYAGLETPDGDLYWMTLGQIQYGGRSVCENIKYFLPFMVAGQVAGHEPARYHCEYSGDYLVNVEKRPLLTGLHKEGTA